MSNQTTQSPLYISFTAAEKISKDAGINDGKGISHSTIRRWAKRGHGPGGFPIVTHPNMSGQIDKEQWVMLIQGTTGGKNNAE